MANSAKKQKLSWLDEWKLQVTYPAIGKTLVFDTAKYPDEIHEDARRHGYKQLFGDLKSGLSAAEKYADAQAKHAALLDGDWARTANRDLTPLIVAAVARIMGKTVKQIQEVADEDLVAEWFANAKVKSAIAEMKAEKLKEAADTAPELNVPGLK